MVAKKTTKKTTKKSAPKKAAMTSDAVEKAVAKGIEKGIKNTFEGKAKKSSKTCSTKHKCGHTGGCIWFLGFVGALIYYVSAASGFWPTVLAILKALVWPALLVFKLLGM